MASAEPLDPERLRLRALSIRLRDATCAAVANQSILASALDESRSELERLLMLDRIDDAERRRVVVRARMMLDAWHGMSGISAAGAH